MAARAQPKPKAAGAKYVPDRGHLIWLEFTPQAGREQAGHRPALVLSPKAYNAKTSLAIVVPITSAVKGFPFEALVPAGGKVGGAVLCDHVRSVDYVQRKATLIEAAPASLLDEVTGKLAALLQLDSSYSAYSSTASRGAGANR